MFRRWQKLEPIQRLGITLLTIGALIAMVGYLNQNEGLDLGHFLNQLFHDFYANFSSELISIAVTILVIDRMNHDREKAERRERELERQNEEKKRLIRQARSKDNAQAVQAIIELRAKGWHEDGSLQGADWHETDLRGADLSRALLTGASLTSANLQSCNLERSIFDGAMLSAANLRECNLDRASLQKAFLIEANLIDASFDRADLSNAHMGLAKLRGAMLRRANLSGADLTEADLTGAFIGATDFSRETTLPDGQKWSPEIDVMRFTDAQHPDYWRSANPGSPAFSPEKPQSESV